MKELLCPECSAPAEFNGERYPYHHKFFRPAVCGSCGYRWGQPVNADGQLIGTEPPAPVVVAGSLEDRDGEGGSLPDMDAGNYASNAMDVSDPNVDSGTGPAEPEVDPAREFELVKVGEGFELDGIAEGDQLLVDYKGEPRRITVNDVTSRTVVAEIDGEPDIRIRKAQVIGRFE